MQKSKTRPISDKIINRQETQQQIIHDSMTKRLVPINLPFNQSRDKQ